MRSVVWLALLLLLFPMYAQDSQDVVTKMAREDVKEVRLSAPGTMTKNSYSAPNQLTMGYWLYKPAVSTNEKLPLIIYLHGSSLRGTDLDQVLVRGLSKYLVNTVDLPAIVICPQCPYSGFWWDSPIKETLVSLIREIIATQNVDEHNVSLTGHSVGGSGVWLVGADYHDLFSRLLPVSGQNRDEDLAQYSGLPIWTFVAEGDDTETYNANLKKAKTLKAMNFDIKMTLVLGTNHSNVPSVVYTNVDVLNWLLGKPSL
jgi:predicted peptidase